MSETRELLTGYFLAGIAAAGAKFTLPGLLPQSAPAGRTIILGCGKAAAEIAGSTYAPLTVTYSLGYGRSDIAPQATASYASNFSVANWDSGLLWDSGLVWDGQTLIPNEIELMGTAENIAMTFANNTDYTGQLTINSLIIHYTPRRGLR